MSERHVPQRAATLSATNFAFNEEPVTTNAGTMTVSDGALLPLGGTIANSGTIALASTGGGTELAVLVENVTLQGGGQVTLSDDGQNVTFADGGNGTLKLDQSALFAGAVSGFGSGDQFDLADLQNSGNTTLGYSANQDGTGGTLTASDGTNTANIVLIGQYAVEDFGLSTDGGLGTHITGV